MELLAILGAPIFGLIGVWLGGRLQAKKDDERWQRELQREGERWRRDDQRRWLDEQYRLYSELMAKMSEAEHATSMACSRHPVYSQARRDETVAAQRLDEAEQFVKAARTALDATALMGHAGILEEASEVYGEMRMACFHARHGDIGAGGAPAMWEAADEVQRAFRQLRRLIREELGVDERRAAVAVKDEFEK